MFDKKITWDETIEKIHKKYYTVENKFTQNQIIKIKNDIKGLVNNPTRWVRFAIQSKRVRHL